MRSSKVRLGVAAVVLAAAVAGALTLAQAGPSPGNVVKCSKYTCTSPGVCQDPYPGNGYCSQGKNGPGFPSDIGCCCCSGADASNRWFHGE